MDKAAEEIIALRSRVEALEWALQHLVVVLCGELDLPEQAYGQWLYTVLDAANRHQTLSQQDALALQRFADIVSGIPESYPGYLKGLLRDLGRSQPDKPDGA